MSKAIPFPTSNSPRIRWVGYVNSWESRINPFTGRPREVPFPVEFSCYASIETEAEFILSQKASAEGYALGGVFGIIPLDKSTSKKATVSGETRTMRRKESEVDKFLRFCDPAVLAAMLSE
jgi:hypothetical protein